MLWTLVGCALLLAAAVVVVRAEGVTLGPYSMRLAAIGVVLAGYYGAFGWLGRSGSAYGRWPVVHYLVPIIAGVGAIYCGARIVQNWRSEMHGLVKGTLRLLIVLVLAALARHSLTR